MEQEIEQAYSGNKIVKIDEERLRFQNKGVNLLKRESKSPFTIHLFKQVSGNLLKMKSEVLINSNLPFMSWRYQNSNQDEFFKNLEDFVKLPRFDNFVIGNRRRDNIGNRWGVTSFDTTIIRIEDIEITFGDELLKGVAGEFKAEFKDKIRKILSKQRFANDKEVKDFTRYYQLIEQTSNLKRQSTAKTNYWSSKPTDYTFKMLLPDEDYNNKLKAVELELESLKILYEFLDIPRFDYKEKEEDLVDEGDLDDYDEDYEE